MPTQKLVVKRSEATNTDILCGRGNGVLCHPGNIEYLKLIKQHQHIYQTGTGLGRPRKSDDDNKAPSSSAISQRDKRKIVKTILATIDKLDPPGRFLKLVGRDTEHGFEEIYHVIEDEDARHKKVSQALREKPKRSTAAREKWRRQSMQQFELLLAEQASEQQQGGIMKKQGMDTNDNQKSRRNLRDGGDDSLNHNITQQQHSMDMFSQQQQQPQRQLYHRYHQHPITMENGSIIYHPPPLPHLLDHHVNIVNPSNTSFNGNNNNQHHYNHNINNNGDMMDHDHHPHPHKKYRMTMQPLHFPSSSLPHAHYNNNFLRLEPGQPGYQNPPPPHQQQKHPQNPQPHPQLQINQNRHQHIVYHPHSQQHSSTSNPSPPLPKQNQDQNQYQFKFHQKQNQNITNTTARRFTLNELTNGKNPNIMCIDSSINKNIVKNEGDDMNNNNCRQNDDDEISMPSLYYDTMNKDADSHEQNKKESNIHNTPTKPSSPILSRNQHQLKEKNGHCTKNNKGNKIHDKKADNYRINKNENNSYSNDKNGNNNSMTNMKGYDLVAMKERYHKTLANCVHLAEMIQRSEIAQAQLIQRSKIATSQFPKEANSTTKATSCKTTTTSSSPSSTIPPKPTNKCSHRRSHSDPIDRQRSSNVETTRTPNGKKGNGTINEAALLLNFATRAKSG